MTASLDLGTLMARVGMDIAPFEAAYAQVVRQMADLAAKAAQTSVSVGRIDSSLASVGDAGNAAAAGLGRADKALAGAGVAASDAATAAKAAAAATGGLADSQTAAVGASTRLRAAQLQLTAASEKNAEVARAWSASTSEVTGSQVALVRAQGAVLAASRDGQAAAARLTAAQLRQAAAQERVATLQASGSASAGRLAAAQASLISSSDAVAAAELKVRDASLAADEGIATSSRAAHISGAALLGVAAAFAYVGKKSIDALDAVETAHARLAGAVHNVGGSMTQLQGAISSTDAHMRSLGFATDETESGLAKLTAAVKNPAEAMRLMSLAADIARGRNIALGQATDILVKVETGHVGLLGRLGIATKDATGHTISQAEALQRLTTLYGGDAQRFAGTLVGKEQQLAAEAKNTAAQFGAALLPAATGLFQVLGAGAHVLGDVVGWLDKNKDAALALGIAIGGPLAVALGMNAARSAVAGLSSLATAFRTTVAEAWAAAGAVTAEGEAVTVAAGETKAASVGMAAAFNPVVLALTAVAAGVAFFWMRNQEEIRKARQEADSFVSSLGATNNNLASVTRAMDATRARIATLEMPPGFAQQFDKIAASSHMSAAGIEHAREQLLALRGVMGTASPYLKELWTDYGKLAAQSQKMTANERELGDVFGLSQQQVESLAQANGIDLTGSMVKLLPVYQQLIQQANLSRHPLAAAATAFSELGNKASTTASDITILDTAWNALVGNFVGMKQAELDAKTALDTLDAALKKSHGSLKLNSQAGQEARRDLLAMAPAIQAVVDSTYKQTGSYGAAASAGRRWLAGIRASGAAGPLVRQLTSDMNRYLSGLASKAPGYGKDTGGGYAKGIGSTRGQATAAARAIQAAAGSALHGGAGPARQQGANFGQGFAAGIMGTIGGAIAAATQLVGAAIAAVKARAKSHSPSLVMMQEGEWFAGGFTLGIGNGTPAAARAAERMARAAVEAAQRARRTVMAGIREAVAPDVTDPGQLARMLHGDVHGAVRTQTRANEAQQANAEAQAHAAALDKVAKRLANEAANARAAAAAIHGSTAAEKAARLAAENRASSLEKVAKASQREAIAADNMATRTKNQYDRLAQAAQNAAQKAQDAATKLVGSVQSAVDAMTQTITGFEQSMASGVAGDTSLSSIWQSLTGTDANGDPITANLGALQGSLDGILVQAQSFSQDLNQIVAEGGGQDLITQLAGMGAQAGDALAQQLLAAGPGAIAALQKTMASIQSVATAEGNVLAKDFYGQGAAALQQLIRGLESQFPALQAALAPIIAEINAVFGAAGVAQKAIPTPAKPAVIAAHATVAPAHVPGFAAGVRNFAGGLAWVGEHGRELVTLPRGASVTPHGSDGASLVDMSAVLAELRELRAAVLSTPDRYRDGTVAVIDRHARTNADTLRRHTRKR